MYITSGNFGGCVYIVDDISPGCHETGSIKIYKKTWTRKGVMNGWQKMSVWHHFFGWFIWHRSLRISISHGDLFAKINNTNNWWGRKHVQPCLYESYIQNIHYIHCEILCTVYIGTFMQCIHWTACFYLLSQTVKCEGNDLTWMWPTEVISWSNKITLNKFSHKKILTHHCLCFRICQYWCCWNVFVARFMARSIKQIPNTYRTHKSQRHT